MEMSAQFPVKKLCSVLNVNRSGFYKWKSRLDHPSDRLKSFVSNICLFKEYHAKYPSHDYRWLNAKIRLDTGLIVSDLYAHRICKTAGIMSTSKHYRYKKPGDPYHVYPNLLMTGLNINGPLQCVVSDMTAFYLKGINTLKSDEKPVVHSDRGCHYRWPEWISIIESNGLKRSMSKKGCSPDNAACEAFFGRLKNEMFYNRNWQGVSVEQFIEQVNEYIEWYNSKRIKLSLGAKSSIRYRIDLGLMA